MKKGSMTRSGLVAALDVGTTKTCCFIARVEDGSARIVGVGHQASRGIKTGTVVDLEAAQQAILNAVHAAEQMAGETIQGVIVNISGGHPGSRTLIQGGDTYQDVIETPPTVTALIRGRQIALPDDNTGAYSLTGWTDNPVHIARHILTAPTEHPRHSLRHARRGGRQ